MNGGNPDRATEVLKSLRMRTVWLLLASCLFKRQVVVFDAASNELTTFDLG